MFVFTLDKNAAAAYVGSAYQNSAGRNKEREREIEGEKEEKERGKQHQKREKEKHTTPGIRWSSPTQLLVWPSLVYLGESGRDPEFSSGYGRM